jgi:hypothetical protein
MLSQDHRVSIMKAPNAYGTIRFWKNDCSPRNTCHSNFTGAPQFGSRCKALSYLFQCCLYMQRGHIEHQDGPSPEANLRCAILAVPEYSLTIYHPLKLPCVHHYSLRLSSDRGALYAMPVRIHSLEVPAPLIDQNSRHEASKEALSVRLLNTRGTGSRNTSCETINITALLIPDLACNKLCILRIRAISSGALPITAYTSETQHYTTEFVRQSSNALCGAASRHHSQYWKRRSDIQRTGSCSGFRMPR